jgi:ubiquinone/menaquinone biosynthesis C-methylase UbiE
MKPRIVEATHRSANRVQKYYAGRAPHYDAASRSQIAAHAEAIHLAEIREGQRVLDVACGTGRATASLARAVGDAGRVDALDLSAAMLDQACAKIAHFGLGRQVDFKRGDARELPYPGESFDLLYSGYLFDLIPLGGFAPILVEFARVLKPRGKLVLVHMSKPDGRKTSYETLYERGWTLTPARPVLMSTFVEAAGFTDVQRRYRPNHGFALARQWGTEIVVARR